jgi:hypothetical protein
MAECLFVLGLYIVKKLYIDREMLLCARLYELESGQSASISIGDGNASKCKCVIVGKTYKRRVGCLLIRQNSSLYLCLCQSVSLCL